MAEYEIEIVETLSKTIVIKAENYTEARRIAIEKYNKEDVVLDASDFYWVDFFPIEEPN